MRCNVLLTVIQKDFIECVFKVATLEAAVEFIENIVIFTFNALLKEKLTRSTRQLRLGFFCFAPILKNL